MLDRYEQLIEVTRLAGREQEAFKLYWFGLGSFAHLGKTLGDYARGHRVLRNFLPADGNRQSFGPGLTENAQSTGLTDLALYEHQLGQLEHAAAIRRDDDERSRRNRDYVSAGIGLQNSSLLATDRGRLHEALAAGDEAVLLTEFDEFAPPYKASLAYRARAAHCLGDTASAQADFAAASAIENFPLLYSNRGQFHARHHLDLGETGACRAIIVAGLLFAQQYDWNHEIPLWHALFARLALIESRDPTDHLTLIREWTARTGEMALIIEAHDLAARAALARADLAAVLAEAEGGLRQARLCGYRLLQIELEVTLSAIHLAWPNANEALAAARRALDLAASPDCGYAWGEADAANAWGEAFVALDQPDHARRAFTQALAVRERIQHPQAAATREALARLG